MIRRLPWKGSLSNFYQFIKYVLCVTEFTLHNLVDLLTWMEIDMPIFIQCLYLHYYIIMQCNYSQKAHKYYGCRLQWHHFVIAIAITIKQSLSGITAIILILCIHLPMQGYLQWQQRQQLSWSRHLRAEVPLFVLRLTHVVVVLVSVMEINARPRKKIWSALKWHCKTHFFIKLFYSLIVTIS